MCWIRATTFKFSKLEGSVFVAREVSAVLEGLFKDFRQALVYEPSNKTASEALSRLKKLLYN